jgi:ABC-type polar amino acid transport system ATPase subunit
VFMDEGRVVECERPDALMSKPREARTRDFLRSILQQS